MKITVQRDQFAKKLQGVINISSASGHIPILREVLFEVEEDRMRIIGSNQEIEITVTVPCQVEGDIFNFICDPELIFTPSSSLKSEELFIEVSKDEVLVYSSRTKNQYSIPINYTLDSFPRMPVNETNPLFKLHGLTLSTVLRKQSSIVNKNDLRPGFTGVTCMKTKERVNLYSGTPNLMLKSKMNIEVVSEEELNFIIPKDIDRVIPIFEASPMTEVQVDSECKNMKITDGSSTIVARLVDAAVITFESIFSAIEKDIFISFIKADFLSAVSRLYKFSNEENILIFDMTQKEDIVVKANNSSFRRKAEEVISFEDKHEAINFVCGMTYQNLNTIIRNIESENLIFSQKSERDNIFFIDQSNPEVESTWGSGPIKTK